MSEGQTASMANTTTVTGIVGSLRRGSVNRAFATSAASNSPADVTFLLHAVDDLPLYNGDVEEAGPPDSVEALHAAVGRSDGLVFFSPEYNGSFPAVTKNVIDWLSRPPRLWDGVAVTMVTASPGPRAGQGVRDHFSAIMARQPVRLFETFGVGTYGDKLDEIGVLNDRPTIDALADFMGRFVEFSRSY